jgi:hypothetical protein
VDGKLDIDTSVWWPDAFIPALQPYGLERVPGFRLKPGKKMPAGWRPTPGEQNPYEDTAWRAEHKDWRIELVDEVRPHIHKKGNGDQKFAAIERMLCAQDPNYFGAVYGHIFDPKAKADEPMRKPFAKFAYQCHNTSAMFEEIKKPHRSFLWRPKSRQLGISVDDEMFDTHFYLWGEGQAKLGSRNEKLVYNGRSYEAMFGKIIYNLQKLDEFTPYLLPAGYSAAKLLRRPWFRDMTLINPITGTALIGESTTKELARGGTYTFARLDESGFMENLADIITSVQEAALHIFLASTERANEYLEMWQAAKRELPKSIYEFNWRSPPPSPRSRKRDSTGKRSGIPSPASASGPTRKPAISPTPTIPMTRRSPSTSRSTRRVPATRSPSWRRRPPRSTARRASTSSSATNARCPTSSASPTS